MKQRFLSILMVTTMTCFSFLSANAQDWAWLERYKSDNLKLTAPAAGENRVVFMGNSITEGWSDHMPEFFQGKPYVNRGISGQTTPQMLLRFRQDVIDLNPAVVVVLAGVNDIAENTGPATLEQIFGNICSMAELAQVNGIRVVLCAVLPAIDFPWKPDMNPANKIIKLNAMIRNYAEIKGYVFLDYHKHMADPSNGLQSQLTYDGVHPNRDGYIIMAGLAEQAIAKALNKP